MLIETGGKKMKKLLIIYYSWSNGNTERIAKMLQSETDSDILKIDTVVPYSGSYDDVVNQGQNEVQRGYEPEIKPLDINIADYDVIAVGTPTWWYTMAPAVKTFLHQQDFTGKTVVPFMTNGGWPGHVIKDMKAKYYYKNGMINRKKECDELIEACPDDYKLIKSALIGTCYYAAVRMLK